MARTKKRRRKAIRKSRKARPAARKPAGKRAKPSRKPRAAARKAKRKSVTKRKVRRAPQAKAARRKAKAAKSARNGQAPRPRPILDRIRRLLADEERLGAAPAAGLLYDGDRVMAGHGGLRAELSRHTEGGPALTAGDVDARWQDAYAVGDETPGGDNPTPDQDRVDDIGKALGIEYQDDEELRGGEEVLERDRHRWEKD